MLTTYQRPREKLMRYGPEKLSDAELPAILLRTGTKERGVLDHVIVTREAFASFKQRNLM